jgi:hypothetical protein
MILTSIVLRIDSLCHRIINTPIYLFQVFLGLLLGGLRHFNFEVFNFSRFHLLMDNRLPDKSLRLSINRGTVVFVIQFLIYFNILV